MYNKEIKTISEINGYQCFFDIEHPLAHSNGRVYMHRHVASIKIGRWLKDDEHVHHIDENRSNNDPNNLQVMSQSEHSSLHMTNRDYNPNHYRNSNRNYEPKLKVEIMCPVCEEVFQQNTPDQQYCSYNCAHIAFRKTDRPSKEELERLISENSWEGLGRMFNVSGNAVKKWARSYGIKIKPRQKKLGKAVCPICNNSFKKTYYEQKLCSKECADLNKRKVDRPTYEELKGMRKTMTFKEIGDKYGVSKDAPREWILDYENQSS